MTLIPAIDLKSGQCVRLHKGRFDQQTTYNIDPVQLAKQYEEQGATYLHIVDLDGAKQGSSQQLQQIIAIKQSCNLSIQVGGGIRTEKQIRTLLDVGIERVVIGSIAMQDVELTTSWIKKFGIEKMVLALDVKFEAKTPLLVSHGWTAATQLSLWDLLTAYSTFKNIQILCTDVGQDGTLEGPNFELYQQCQQRFPQMCFQASGGIAELNDLVELNNIGVSATIIGKALFENRFTLAQALTEVEQC